MALSIIVFIVVGGLAFLWGQESLDFGYSLILGAIVGLFWALLALMASIMWF
jgi:hypothetical protein